MKWLYNSILHISYLSTLYDNLSTNLSPTSLTCLFSFLSTSVFCNYESVKQYKGRSVRTSKFLFRLNRGDLFNFRWRHLTNCLFDRFDFQDCTWHLFLAVCFVSNLKLLQSHDNWMNLIAAKFLLRSQKCFGSDKQEAYSCLGPRTRSTLLRALIITWKKMAASWSKRILWWTLWIYEKVGF